MVSRAWTTYNPSTNRVLSFGFILADEHSGYIHGKVPAYLVHKFKNLMIEGRVYTIHKFVVMPYKTSYRPLRRDIFIQFSNATSVVPSPVDPCLFTPYVFDFVSFNLLPHRIDDDKYLTDVIGVLRVWGPLSNQSRSSVSFNKDHRYIILANESGTKVSVTLWGSVARMFNDEKIRSYGAMKVVVILISCRVRGSKCAPALMTSVASHMYLNLSVPEVDIYHNIYALPVTFEDDKHQKEDIRVTPISKIYTCLMQGVAQGTMYVVDATILDVDMTYGWTYVECNTCHKNASVTGAHYFCSACQKKVVNPRQVYKLVIRVSDEEEEMMCVLFDEAARAIISLTADEIVAKSLAEGRDDAYWIHQFLVDNLCAKRIVVKIKISEFNLLPIYNRHFTVCKYFGNDVKMIEKRVSPTATSTILPIKRLYLAIKEILRRIAGRLPTSQRMSGKCRLNLYGDLGIFRLQLHHQQHWMKGAVAPQLLL